MITIAFIHSHKSFLPEIDAYIDFFSKSGIKTEVIDSKMHPDLSVDVEWYFMGMNRAKKKNDMVVVHEYASASTPPFNKEKNILKRLYNIKPDYRLFLNQYVKDALNFKDNIPFGLRDMGVNNFFLNSANEKKEYDFIYVGSVASERRIEKLLHCFTEKNLSTRSILVLSRDYQRVAKQFNVFSNISFAGPVPHEKVSEYISKAKFCVNYIPDREPFNQQTSVKFLEYLALQIPVITSRYAWTVEFQKRFGGDFFYLEENLSNFTWENILAYNYSFPDLHEWQWDNQIKKSGILEFLQSKFKELHF